jgi:L-2,4-diaminobutyric acid acetyltransferase
LEPNSCYAYLLLCHHFHDTCVVAEGREGLLGFLSAYLPPGRPDTVFCWQVAVHPDARGRKWGLEMLRELLRRPGLARVAYLEATVGPSNLASAGLFRALARSLEAPCEESVLFDRNLFGRDAHEDERLFRIGPLKGGPIQPKEANHEPGNLHEA